MNGCKGSVKGEAVPQTNLKPSASGFKFERRSSGASELSAVSDKETDGSEGSGACDDEIKLERAQGECLGIRSR